MPDSETVSAPPVTKLRLLDYVILVSASLSILAFLVHETASLDVWWQVAVGKNVLASGELARVDVYRVAAEGGRYYDAHWLFQLLLALMERIAGMGGVQLVTLGFWIPTLLLLYRGARHWVGVSLAAALVFMAAMASVERFLPRPEIVTFFGVAAFWVLLQEERDRSWPGRLLFGAIQVMWTACHGLFVIGPFLVGCAWLESLVAHWQGRPSELRSRSLTLGVVLLATLISPFGLEPWRYAILMIFQIGGGWAPTHFSSISELSPTFGDAARSGMAFWFFLVLLIGTAIAGVWATLRGFRSPGRTLALLGLLAAALTGRRNIILFALAAAPFLAECLATLVPLGRRWRSGIWTGGVAIFMLAWAWVPLSGRYYMSMEISTRFGWGVTPSFFPHGLPAFLDGIDFRGNVLNSNTIGGFYLYHGFPERRPLIDGSWVTVEPELLEWIHKLTNDPLAWRLVVERFDIEGILLAHTSSEAAAILPSIAGDTGWRLVYYDAAASFWLPEAYPNLPPAIDLGDPETLPPLVRVEDGLILSAFLHRVSEQRVGAKRLLGTVLQETLEFGWKPEPLLEQLAPLQLELEQFAAAEESYLRLLSFDEENASVLNELAFLAYQRGDVQGATTLMKRALELEPDNVSYRNNYERLGIETNR